MENGISVWHLHMYFLISDPVIRAFEAGGAGVICERW